MRTFTDTWQTLFDSAGRPLLGKVLFCYPSSTEKKSVYDIDGNSLSNPVYTSDFGITASQVMLLDEDYTIYFYQYIGSGVMESDDDDSNWILYKTIFSSSEQSTSVDTDSSCTSLESLRSLDVEEGASILLLGRESIGDIPPTWYTYYPESTLTEDGGVVIASSDGGNWIATLDHTWIDARLYGVYPAESSSSSSLVTNQSQLQNFVKGCIYWARDAYFPPYGRLSSGFYHFDDIKTMVLPRTIIEGCIQPGTSDLTLIFSGELIHSDTALFPSTTREGETRGRVYVNFQKKNQVIDNTWSKDRMRVNTTDSIGTYDTFTGVEQVNSYEGAYRYYTSGYFNVRVKNVSGILSGHFTSCEFMDNEVIGSSNDEDNPIRLTNCELWARIFSDSDWSSTYVVIDSSCTWDLTMVGWELYKKLKSDSMDYSFGDCRENSFTGDEVSGTIQAENAAGTLVVTKSGSSLELSHFSGSVVLNEEVEASLTLYNSEVTIKGDGSITQLKAQDSTITCSLSITEKLTLQNSTVSSITEESGCITEIDSSTIQGDSTFYGGLEDCIVMTNSQFQGAIEVFSDTQGLWLRMEHDNLESTLKLTGSSSLTTVNYMLLRDVHSRSGVNTSISSDTEGQNGFLSWTDIDSSSNTWTYDGCDAGDGLYGLSTLTLDGTSRILQRSGDYYLLYGGRLTGSTDGYENTDTATYIFLQRVSLIIPESSSDSLTSVYYYRYVGTYDYLVGILESRTFYFTLSQFQAELTVYIDAYYRDSDGESHYRVMSDSFSLLFSGVDDEKNEYDWTRYSPGNALTFWAGRTSDDQDYYGLEVRVGGVCHGRRLQD